VCAVARAASIEAHSVAAGEGGRGMLGEAGKGAPASKKVVDGADDTRVCGAAGSAGLAAGDGGACAWGVP